MNKLPRIALTNEEIVAVVTEISAQTLGVTIPELSLASSLGTPTQTNMTCMKIESRVHTHTWTFTFTDAEYETLMAGNRTIRCLSRLIAQKLGNTVSSKPCC